MASAAASPELFPVPIEPHSRRLQSLDMLRGLLMILMALDHTREYFSNNHVNPVDPQSSWPLLFATRWITHLCAPGFIALAGASVYLQRRRGKAVPDLRRLLITRGLWLMFLEVTVISFGWSFAFVPFLQVIWAIGFAMIALGIILPLPDWGIGSIGAAIALFHNLLDPIDAARFGRFKDLWMILHQPGLLRVHGHTIAADYYSVLPWFGVICLGYAFGPVASAAAGTRRRIAVGLAAAFLLAFTLLRLLHGYGDSNPLERFPAPARTMMSFLNVQKYPPSLQYVLVTLGMILLAYAALDLAASRGWLPGAGRILETFGRVPFFYYVPHIYLLHLLALLGTAAEHGDWHLWFGTSFLMGDLPAGWGFSLPVIYVVWIAVVTGLYGPCLWFSRLKSRRRDWWLSYL